MGDVKRQKGYRFDGPDGQYYVLTREVEIGDPIMASDFEAHNGAPEPEARGEIPVWLAKQIGGYTSK